MSRRIYHTFVDKSLCRELFDSIKKGDYVKINDWRRGMKVHGVSANYILAGTKAFNGEWLYTVIEKKLWTGQYNQMDKNTFICGPDDMLFGFYHDHAYEMDNEEFVKDYLQAFEDGKVSLSRRAVSIYTLYLWRAEDDKERD